MSAPCCVPSCDYRKLQQRPSQRRSLFKFPLDESRAQIWINQIPGLNVQSLHSSSKVCEVHFDPRFIKKEINVNTGGLRRSLLLGNAIPTLNLVHENGQESVKTEKFSNLMNINSQHQVTNGEKDYSFYRYFSENFHLLINNLPKSWDIEKLDDGQAILFYSEYNVDGSNRATVTHRKVIVLKSDDSVSFHTNGKQVTLSQCNSDLASIKSVKHISSLRNIIVQFDRLKVCEGVDKKYLETFEQTKFVQISPRNYRLVNCLLIIDQSDNQCLLCRDYLRRAEQNYNPQLRYSFFKDFSDNFEFFRDILPSSWEIKKHFVEGEDVFIFCIEYGVDGINGWTVYHRKLITLREDDSVNFFANGAQISETYLSSITSVKDMNTLRQIMLDFDRLKVCEGVDQSCVQPFEQVKFVQISPRNFRLVDCSIIIDSSDRQCTLCREYNVRNKL